MSFTDRILSQFGYTKATTVATDRPDYGQQQWDNNYFNSYWQNYWGTSRGTIDYRRELGDYKNVSLIMAISNWTGMNLAEALPVVTKPDSSGVAQIDSAHPAAALIRRPNPFHIWADYCQAGAFDWWMGNWYLKKVHDLAGDVSELWYLPQYLIEPRWPNDGRTPEVDESDADNEFLSHYQYNLPGRPPQMIARRNMIHIKRGVLNSNSRKGEGVWDAVLEETYGDQAVARFSATLMKNMGKIGFLLSPKDKDTNISKEDAARIKQQFILGSTGENANTPMVNPVSLDVTNLSFDPKQLDLKELRNVPESRVAGVTGIPAIVLQFLVGLEHGHYGAAYEQARQQGYENVIIPIQKHIAEDLTWQLLPELDKTAGARIDFDISKVRVLQEDRDALYKRESDALRSGGITVDQFLTSIGKDAVGPPLGDVRYVPAMSTPMSPERLITAATTEPVAPVVPVDPALAKLMDMDSILHGLDDQMNEFMAGRAQDKAVSSLPEAKRLNIGYKLRDVAGMPPDAVIEIKVNKSE